MGFRVRVLECLEAWGLGVRVQSLGLGALMVGNPGVVA